jgi:hypothetical protein
MITYDANTKMARELKEEVSALKKQLKDLDAGDRDLRLRIQAYDTSVSHLATL